MFVCCSFIKSFLTFSLSCHEEISCGPHITSLYRIVVIDLSVKKHAEEVYRSVNFRDEPSINQILSQDITGFILPIHSCFFTMLIFLSTLRPDFFNHPSGTCRFCFAYISSSDCHNHINTKC